MPYREFGISVIPVDRQDAGSVTHVFSHILHHYCVERITLPADAAGVVAACTGTTLHEKRAWKWVSARDMKVRSAARRRPGQLRQYMAQWRAAIQCICVYYSVHGQRSAFRMCRRRRSPPLCARCCRSRTAQTRSRRLPRRAQVILTPGKSQSHRSLPRSNKTRIDKTACYRLWLVVQALISVIRHLSYINRSQSGSKE